MESKGSFWTSLPGCLTAIAGILAAVATIVGVVLSQGSHHNPTWGDQANAICAAAIENGSGYVPSGSVQQFNSQLPAAAQMVINLQSVDDQLRKLPASGQDQSTVSSMLGYWDQTNTDLRAAIQAAQNGDTAAERQDLLNSDYFNRLGNNLANDLGAGTCASGSF